MTKFFGNVFNNSANIADIELVTPFEMKLTKAEFCEIKVETLYSKILHRCYSKSEGAKEDDKMMSLFDSREKSGAAMGLISLIARAMARRQSIGIIYKSGVVMQATFDERIKIEADYEKSAKSSQGVIIDFTNYKLTKLVEGYMELIYDILKSVNTHIGLANALQVKINNLRGTVSVAGKDEPIAQAKSISAGLKAGRPVLLDKNDQVDLMSIDSDPIKNAMALVYGELASALGVSLAFVSGVLASGMSATGEADANATEEGMQDFFNSIFKPTCDNLYGWKLRFISDDWRYFSSMIDSVLIVENSNLFTPEQKKAFADRLMPVASK
tara:strand:- start:472 stop:1452 length:981 start_codon:yes stop_codon:yes gene_type:complete